MNTRSLIDFVKRSAPSWNRSDILDFINDAQNEVFDEPVESMKYRDPINGGDAILTTVDGVVNYELSASSFGADIQFIKNVYPLNYNDKYYYQSNYSNDIIIETKDGDQSSKATVYFSENPGDNEYYVECYRQPNAIESETSVLEIPSGMVKLYFYHGVIGAIQMVEHGESNAYERFVNEGIPNIRYKLNMTGHTNIFLPDYRGY